MRERIGSQGEIVEPLAVEDVADAVRKLVADGVEAVAVCLLFAYANPAHEQAAAEIIRAIAPGLYVSLSHEVNPEWREYERTASTVANGYIGPPVARYLHTLEALSLRRFPRSRALMMKSDGGAASARMLERTPIQTVMSGPVAGVIGGRHLGDVKGIENLITFDTGGTSSDMAVLPGAPLFKSEVTVARHPLRTHTVDIETIGAGGGSIASVQLGHVLKVGPQSAGADPGPACYGRGGREPTLTDALVLLGHLNPTALLEGAMPIDAARAHEAVVTRVASPLGMTAIEAAWGILRVLATNVMVAMRTITVERGYDPRDFTLVPFGGMGPTIAGMIAAELGIARILIPRDPGTFSAHGMLVTDVQQERSRTRITPVEATTPAELDAIFAEMEAAALADLMQEQFPRERLQTRRHAGMRYRGQSYEVSVPVPSLRGPDDLADLVAAVSRRASAALRPHGAGRGGRDRQFPGDGGRTHSEARDEDIRCGRRRSKAARNEASLFQCRRRPRRVGLSSQRLTTGHAARRAGDHRGADVDHRALSGPARGGGCVFEYRGRGAGRRTVGWVEFFTRPNNRELLPEVLGLARARPNLRSQSASLFDETARSRRHPARCGDC